MTGTYTASAFIKSQAFRQVSRTTTPAILYSIESISRSAPRITSVETIFRTGTALHSKAAAAAAAGAVSDVSRIVESCLSFFDSTKIVSTLLLGFSLSALLTFTRDVQETFQFTKSRVYVMRLYHVASFLSFCFSLMTLVAIQLGSMTLLTTTITTTTSMDAFSFLNNNIHMEFLLTRWNFLMSILSFFISVTLRLILEFGLFGRGRRGAGTMVVSSILGLICCMISFSNSTAGHPSNLLDLVSMTKELAKTIWERAYVARLPMPIAALSFFAIAALCSIRFLFPGNVEHDQLIDTERYL